MEKIKSVRIIWITFTLFALILTSEVHALVKKHSGDFSFKFNQMTSEFGKNSGNKYWSDFNYLYYFQEPFIDEERKIDLSMRYNDAGGLMYSLKEAQITRLGRNYEISFGRILIDWSEIDSKWGLGKINNRVNFDFFEPGQEGLIGIRLKKSLGDFFVFDIFASAFYIPQLNPASDINSGDGSITSKNPWSDTPPSSIIDNRLATDPIRIFYRVDNPALEDIIFRESYGLNFIFSPIEEIHLTAFYLYKPENELSTDLKIVPDINPNLQIEIFVDPKVYDHQVYGGQLDAILWKRLKLYGSYLITNPGTKPQDPENLDLLDLGFAFDTDKQKEEYIGAGIEYLGQTLKLGVAFISRVSDFFKSNELVRSPRWSQALNFNMFLSVIDGLDLKLDIKYDTLTKDRLYMFDMSYRFLNHFWLSVGANVIGTPDDGSGYWVPYRTNDTFYTQAGVLF